MTPEEVAEYAKALEIAERWKSRLPDHMKDTVSGALFEELGIVSRALLHADKTCRVLRQAYEGD